MHTPPAPHISALVALADRLRPADPHDTERATRALQAETTRLQANVTEAQYLRYCLLELLDWPQPQACLAESGIRSAGGFWLELGQRFGHKLLPPLRSDADLPAAWMKVFSRPNDHIWVEHIDDADWLALLHVLGLEVALQAVHHNAVLDAARIVSYRLAGAALDRELLRADPALEAYESPFLSQNTALVPRLREASEHQSLLRQDDIAHIDVLLAQCQTCLEGIRRRAREQGISIRLTFLLARMRQLIERLRVLLAIASATEPLLASVRLFKTLLHAEKTRRHSWPFIADNVELLARNVTERAGQHGEHYIANTRAEWWAMLRSAMGGGIIIALMAACKLQIGLQHLPPLIEALAVSLNYGLGFTLIHVLGGTVATKQPAMTAASIAATLEEARPRELGRLAGLVQNLIRTQFIAVLGNIALALPVACLLAWLWPYYTGHAIAPDAKTTRLLQELDPLSSGSVLFAAVAGVGLFLAGLVSGFFDNKARYHDLAPRLGAAPMLQWLGAVRAAHVAAYVDAHVGAILGNVFFGFYLGMMGALGHLTGLPIDIRHVAFASANVGTAVLTLDAVKLAELLPWAIAGVVGIALINLLVSFSLALYVALQSRQLGAKQCLRLGSRVGWLFVIKPLSFITPPPPGSSAPEIRSH